jgi:hypothetical protein
VLVERNGVAAILKIARKLLILHVRFDPPFEEKRLWIN